MIQSPVLLELIAESRQQDILRFLRARFADVPPDVTLAVQAVQDKEQLNELIDWAAQCPDLEAFRGRLPGVNPAS